MTVPLSYKLAKSAFSLVEVTMAIGITAFSLVSIVGLLPVGLELYSKAVNASVSSQIVQQVTTDVQQADFDLLTNNNGGLKQFPIRYFDEQGTARGDATNPPAQSSSVIYHVAYGVTTSAANSNLAKVTIDVLNNPGNKTLTRDSATGGVVNNPAQGISATRFSVLIARNK